TDGPFQMLVTTLDWDNFQGKFAIGRIKRGTAKPGMSVALMKDGGVAETARIDKVYVSQGLKRLEAASAEAGDVVTRTGIKYSGAVTSEVGRRKGILVSQSENADQTTRLVFEITTRGLLGLRNALLTQSRGTAVMNSLFLRYEPLGAPIPKLRNGVLIASEA